jgi:hypothetical protein
MFNTYIFLIWSLQLSTPYWPYSNLGPADLQHYWTRFHSHSNVLLCDNNSFMVASLLDNAVETYVHRIAGPFLLQVKSRQEIRVVLLRI